MRLYRLYHYLPVQAVAFDPEGRRLAVAVGDPRHHQTPGAGQVLEARTGRELYRLHHDYSVKTVGFNADGSRVVFAGTRSARVFEVRRGDELFQVDHEQDLASVVFHPDDRRLLTLAEDPTGPARVFESRSAEVSRIDHGSWPRHVEVSTDGSTAFISERDEQDRECVMRAVDTLTAAQHYATTYTKDTWLVATSADGVWMVFACGGEAQVHDVRGRTAPLVIHHAGCRDDLVARITADGERIVTAAGHRGRRGLGRCQTTILRITDLRDGAPLSSVQLAGEALAISEDGTLAVVLVEDEDAQRSFTDHDHTDHGLLAVVGTTDGAERCRFRARKGRSNTPNTPVCFGPGGDWVAALCEQSLALLWTSDGRRLWSTDLDFDARHVIVSPTGSHIAVIDETNWQQHRLALVDARAGTRFAAYESGTGGCSAFSADGRRFAVLRDGAARVIDLDSGETLCIVGHERDAVNRVAFVGREGAHLLTGDHRSLRVSCLDTTALLAEAGARLTRKLTESERQRYLPGSPTEGGQSAL